LEYIATVLEDLVEKVTLIDMRFETNLDDFIGNGHTDLVCLSVNWDYQHDATVNLIDRIPSHHKVVVGGRYATTCVEELFAVAPNLDIIVRGDGEEIIRDMALGLPLKDIPGISYRENGGIIHNKIRDLRSLDDALYPNRKLRRVKYRLSYKNIDLGQGVDFISTSKGCPYHCKFCTFTNNPLGQKRNWSGRSASSVVEELKTIDAGFVFVVDDNFAADMKRVEKICDLIIAEGIKKTFAVAVRLEIYKHPRILEKMFNAGFKILTIGIESAQDKTLRMMQKGFDTALAEKAFAEIRKVKFFIHGYFIIGCIGENEAEMLEITPFAKRLKLDTFNLSLLRTEKYSPLNELIANSGGYYVGEKNIVCSEKYPLKVLRNIRHRIGRSYYNLPTILRIARKIIAARLISFHYVVKSIFIFSFRLIVSKGKTI
ncbi:MAG TPA: radical SAM protein, partial [Thermodesulfobacteriota bacterium]|nr:radical SAM protein [Thermodesulfobacteriota bacterium]